MFGSHCLKTWSKTQAVLAKSSAESELYAAVKGGCEGLGVKTLLKEMGVEAGIRLHLDASAAKGILERVGLSKVRHLDVDTLWMQEQDAKKLISVRKVWGEDNPADMMTKSLPQERSRRLLEMMQIWFVEGRSSIAVKLQSLELDPLNLTTNAGEGDKWVCSGIGGTWIRAHHTWRRALFTPYKVSKGPGKNHSLQNKRITRGVYDNGEMFVVEDDWTQQLDAHKLLSRKWRGFTVFFNDHAAREAPQRFAPRGEGECRR